MEEAEAALGHISTSLAEGGILIATGVSGSFLHPSLLHRAALDVVHGSRASKRAACEAAPAGIEHHLGRMQFFVLRKRHAASSLGGDTSCLFSALAGVTAVA